MTITGSGDVPCVFCEIAAGRAPAARIAENHQALAFWTSSHSRRGTSWCSPKKRVLWAQETSDELSVLRRASEQEKAARRIKGA